MNNEWELGRKVTYYNGTLQKFRLQKGLKQEEVAQFLGVSAAAYSHYETLRSIPSKEKMEKLATFFGTKVEILFPEFLSELIERTPKTEIKYAKLTAEAIEAFSEKQLLLEEEISDPEEVFRKKDIISKLGKILEEVSPRRRKVIELYYGLNGKTPRTLAEIGEEMSISQSRVTELREKGFQEIRKNPKIKEIKAYDNFSL